MKHTYSTSRIQYSALVILLNRHNAGYGDPERVNSADANKSRNTCVEFATKTSKLVEEYTIHHGSANTMLGSALYNITMAATVLIAEVAEKRRQNVNDESAALAICLDAMKEMEGAEIVARNVRKIVQTIMRVCSVRRSDASEAQAGFVMNDAFPAAQQLPYCGTQEDTITTTTDDGNIRDMMTLGFDPCMSDSVFQFPFEEALLDPLSASAFLQQ